jgi:2EXR family
MFPYSVAQFIKLSTPRKTMADVTTFPHFEALPFELKEQIWRYSLPDYQNVITIKKYLIAKGRVLTMAFGFPVDLFYTAMNPVKCPQNLSPPIQQP